MSEETVEVYSAPGKALLAGGYLVLDPQFDAYVVALSSRMHAVVRQRTSDSNGSRIVVKSPQFLQGEWSYLLDDSIDTFAVTEINGRKNPFAQFAVSNVLAYVNPYNLNNINVEVTIFSDSGYHSQDNTTIKTSGTKSFSYHSKPITEVSKTGLGSSAGLVTVLTTALLSVLVPNFNIKSQDTLKLIHNLAQVSHCQAQGKVGSGFDVAAATFGSIVYRRFDPSLINNLKPIITTSKSEYHNQLFKLVNETDWKIKNDRVALPKKLKLVMGDIKGGSETPKLVSKVQKWRESDPDSEKVYSILNSSNTSLVESLASINNQSIETPDIYNDLLKFISTHESSEILSSQNSELKHFKNLISAVDTIRTNFRLITERSGADIEPPQQTELLDACSKIPGVLAGVVPGAGGYDAISLVVAEDSIELLTSLTRNNAIFDSVSWLNLREEDEGIVKEDLANYIDLI